MEDKIADLKRHLQKWKNCELCLIGETAFNKCMLRWEFDLPSDILFIGEAPGTSEDAIGEPFVGPAGEILDELIKRAMPSCPFSYSISNIIACLPHDGDRKFRIPTTEEQKNCFGRLLELLNLVDPKGIVLLGKVARDSAFGSFIEDRPVISILHPSFILRTGGVKSLAFARLVRILTNFVRRIKDGKGHKN